MKKLLLLLLVLPVISFGETTKYFFNIDEGMSAKYQMTLDELEGWCFASTFLNTSNNGTPATKTLQRALKVYQPLIKKIVPLREVCIAETGATTQGELNTCLRRKLQGTPNLNIVIAALNIISRTEEFDKRVFGTAAIICAHNGPDGFY